MLALLAAVTVCPWAWASSLAVNGWIYDDPSNPNMTPLASAVYDSLGRVTSGVTSGGCAITSMSYSGPGPDQYAFSGTDCNGTFSGTVSRVPSNANEKKNSGSVAATETTRAASQMTTSLIATRISAILAPTPSFISRQPGAVPPGPGAAPGSPPAGAPGPDPGIPGGQKQEGGAPTSSNRKAAPSGTPPVVAGASPARLFSLDDRTVAACLDPEAGLAAGAEAPRYGLWGTGSLANMQDFQTSTRYEGNMYLFMGGFDFKLADEVLVGAAAGYENTFLNTVFNQGSLQAEGYTIAPYAAYKFSDTTTADVLAGVTFLSYDTHRASIGGSYQAVRSMVSMNLNQYFVFENWVISGVLGNMYANEHAESFSESDGTQNGGRENYLGELRVGGKVSYVFGRFEASGGLAYLYDYMMRYTGEMPDQDAFEGTVGLNYRPTDNWIIGVEGLNSFDRAHAQNLRMMGNVRYEF